MDKSKHMDGSRHTPNLPSTYPRVNFTPLGWIMRLVGRKNEPVAPVEGKNPATVLK